jgi:glutamyl-tRNA synthetase
LGWNDGSGEEVLSLEELTNRFTIERIHKGGAKFDFEKAKWFNGEWIKKSTNERLFPLIKNIFQNSGIHPEESLLLHIIPMVKDRCHLLNDFIQQSSFFFVAPTEIDTLSVKPKWTESKTTFFKKWMEVLQTLPDWDALTIENEFKKTAEEEQIKPGELQLPLRIMLVGGKFGPPVFEIASMIGKSSTISRIQSGLQAIEQA